MRLFCFGATCISRPSCSVRLPFQLAFQASFREFVLHCAMRDNREGIRIFHVFLIVISISF